MFFPGSRYRNAGTYTTAHGERRRRDRGPAADPFGSRNPRASTRASTPSGWTCWRPTTSGMPPPSGGCATPAGPRPRTRSQSTIASPSRKRSPERVASRCCFGDGAREADEAFYEQLAVLEVEENADLPGAVQLTVPIASHGPAGAEDLTGVGDDRFKPYARIAVVVTPNGGQRSTCIFDGHVLSHKIHLDRGTTAATLRVWGQDRSCLMNLKEVVKEWSDKTDGQIANDIFGQYGLEKAPDNEKDDSGQHTEAGHTVMQRSTDAQFLRDRARRNGKLFRVLSQRRDRQEHRLLRQALPRGRAGPHPHPQPPAGRQRRCARLRVGRRPAHAGARPGSPHGHEGREEGRRVSRASSCWTASRSSRSPAARATSGSWRRASPPPPTASPT